MNAIDTIGKKNVAEMTLLEYAVWRLDVNGESSEAKVAADKLITINLALDVAKRALLIADSWNADASGNGYGAWTNNSEAQKVIDVALDLISKARGEEE